MDTKRTTILDFVAAFFFIGVVAVSMFTFVAFSEGYKEAKASSDWPQVIGIVSQTANPTYVKGGKNHETVWYEYAVGGKTYHSCRVKFFEPDALTSSQIAKSVTVYYDPKHPREACLVQGISYKTVIKMMAFLGVLCAGIFSISYFVYSATPSPRSERAMANAARKRAQVAFQNREWLHYA